jgi:hypothetical protein
MSISDVNRTIATGEPGMAVVRNIDRLREDLKRLLTEADLVITCFNIEVYGLDETRKAHKKEAAEDLLKKLPPFGTPYEAWYSECLALIKQLLPDRLQNFRDHFESPKNRKEITYDNYRIQDALKGLRVTLGTKVIADQKAAAPHLRQQVAILAAAERRFESSLFEIRQLVQADLFDSELGAARELLKNKFLRAAGAIAGVVLEKHLRQVSDDHDLTIQKKNPAIYDLNELLKSNSVVDVPQWRFISMLGDIRNLCDHKKQKDPTEQQVTDLIDGTDKVLKTVF